MKFLENLSKKIDFFILYDRITYCLIAFFRLLFIEGKLIALRKTIIFVCILFLSSCASVPIKPTYEVIGTAQIPTQMTVPFQRQDIFHIVGPGETIWRIGKMYDVEMSDIVKANNLESVAMIYMGQELIIPNAAPIRPIIPLYSSDKWEYIIVHHSATDEGNAFAFYNMHLRRGFWNGLGYHFVIDNGTSGKLDGQIEISPRWIKQQNGAHCQASGMNAKGIGICLVGNFSKENVSDNQMESLIYLVNILKKYYDIPKQNIVGHGDVPGAATECPGFNFPWDEFQSSLD